MRRKWRKNTAGRWHSAGWSCCSRSGSCVLESCFHLDSSVSRPTYIVDHMYAVLSSDLRQMLRDVSLSRGVVLCSSLVFIPVRETRKVAVGFVMSALLSAWNNWATTGHICVKFYIEGFCTEVCRRNSGLGRIGQNNGHCTWRHNVHLCHVAVYEISTKHTVHSPCHVTGQIRQHM